MRYSKATLDAVIYWVGLIVFLLVPTLALLVLVFGIVATKATSRVRNSAVLYWAYWPTWAFILCYLAAIIGTGVGDDIYSTYLYEYYELNALQEYSSINPVNTTGERYQDAGVVTFISSAGVDIARGGCQKDGSVYCIAPVLQGSDTITAESTTGYYDFFMAGIGCCTCPFTEFRCGAWDTSGDAGGYRLRSASDVTEYKKAAEAWASTYSKNMSHPLFFEMVEDSDDSFTEIAPQGWYEAAVAWLLALLGFMLIYFVLNTLLKCLQEGGWASAIDTPMPPPGIGRMLVPQVLPQMHKHYMRQLGPLDEQEGTFVVL